VLSHLTYKNTYIWFFFILGDLMDEENVLDFLTSLEAMDRPDRIEEVNAKILSKIVEETDFVAVLFCKSSLVLLSSLYTLIIGLYLSQNYSEDFAQLFKAHSPKFIVFFSNKISCVKCLSKKILWNIWDI